MKIQKVKVFYDGTLRTSGPRSVRPWRWFSERVWFFLSRHLLILLVIGNFTVVTLISGCAGSGFIRKSGYVPGIYEGSGRGYRGSVQVRVQISSLGIDDVVITDHEERYPGIAALDELLEAVLESGSTDLDVVSGATFSSRGFLEAVDDAVRKARLH